MPALWHRNAPKRMGKINKNDEVIVVERLSPWSPGSCIYEEAAEDVKVFIDDIVMIDIIVEL